MKNGRFKFQQCLFSMIWQQAEFKQERNQRICLSENSEFCEENGGWEFKKQEQGQVQRTSEVNVAIAKDDETFVVWCVCVCKATKSILTHSKV